MDFPGGSAGKESTGNTGDLGSIPGLGRSPGGQHGNSLQCSCMENGSHGSQRVGHNWATFTLTQGKTKKQMAKIRPPHRYILDHLCTWI